MRFRVFAVIALLLCACNLFARLKKKDVEDSGTTTSTTTTIDPPEESDADPNALLKMLGLGNEAPAVKDGGCPAPVHPGYLS